MKSLFPKTLAKPGAVIAISVASLLSAGVAEAAAVGTPSNIDITNTATLTYSVGGTPQTAIPSNQSTFKVDNKVNVLVAEFGGTVTNVAPGATNQATTFTVTNNGNTSQGYNLVAAVGTAGLIPATTGTAGSLTVTNIRVFADTNNSGSYDAGDVQVTSISSLASGDSVKVFVVADMPTGAGLGVNGDQAHVSLTAITTTAGTTTAVTQTTGADTAGLDIVFADAETTESGFVGASPARDGQGTARDAYRIATAAVTVSKTVALICDPFNGDGTDRKNIPGSIVRYTITVSNATTAPASATLATMTDALNASTTFDPNLVTGAGAPATATSCTSSGPLQAGGAAGSGFKIVQTERGITGSFLTNSSGDTDGASLTGSTVTINYAQALPAAVVGGVSYTAGELKKGESVVVYFNAIIN